MSIKEEAEATLAELRRRGWTQNTYADERYGDGVADCQVCLLGAYLAANHGTPWATVIEDLDDTAAAEAAEAATEGEKNFRTAFHDVIGKPVVTFNDEVAKSQQDVENALLKLIEAHS